MTRRDDLSLSRRQLVGLGMIAAAGTLGQNVQRSFPLGGTSLAQQESEADPTPMSDIAALAADVGGGEPLTLVDLDALDTNIEHVRTAAADRGWAIRPSLKSFQNPHLSAYVLERLPEPRGMFFHLRDLEELLALGAEGEFPAGADLMSGYVPTFGELEQYFADDGSDEPPHSVRWMIDDPLLLERCSELAADSERALPVEVAFEFDAGMQRGGIKGVAELDAMVEILREYEDVLSLTGLMCYDGHATVDASSTYRQSVAKEAQRRYRTYVDYLQDEASDVYDHETVIRNGPGSSNYKQWDTDSVLTEISPGTAFTFDGYLTESGFDNEGLVPTLYHAAPVMRKPASSARLPFHDISVPAAVTGDVEEVVIKGGAWPSNNGEVTGLLWPDGLSEDPLGGGRGNNTSALLAPSGELSLGEYVLVRPQHAGDGIEYFGTVHAVRDGELVAAWPTYRRW